MMKRSWWREQGGIGRVQKLFRYSPVCVDTLLILVLLAACVQPCWSDWVGRAKRWGGAEHMSFFVVIRWLGLRKSRTWLRPFSGHRRNRPGRGPLCVPPPPVHLLMQTRRVRPSFADICTKHHHQALISHSEIRLRCSWPYSAFPDSSRCTCGLNLGHVVSMLFRCWPQTDSFACTHKLHPIHSWLLALHTVYCSYR